MEVYPSYLRISRLRVYFTLSPIWFHKAHSSSSFNTLWNVDRDCWVWSRIEWNERSERSAGILTVCSIPRVVSNLFQTSGAYFLARFQKWIAARDRTTRTSKFPDSANFKASSGTFTVATDPLARISTRVFLVVSIVFYQCTRCMLIEAYTAGAPTAKTSWRITVFVIEDSSRTLAPP